MKLEHQVVSLELAKKLKELGVKQESYFAWFYDDGMSEWELSRYQDDWPKDEWPANDIRQYSAFTVAELGELLPVAFADSEMRSIAVNFGRYSGGWSVGYKYLVKRRGEKQTLHRKQAASEADARAEMLIYLLENKLYAVDAPAQTAS